jgi:general stress protein YciG
MSVSEAGRKGGLSTAKRYGPAFFEQIGKKGGRIGGPKGGRMTKERYGHEFYEEIGRRGGQKVKRLIKSARKLEK